MPCRHRRKRKTKGAQLNESQAQNVFDLTCICSDSLMPLNARRRPLMTTNASVMPSRNNAASKRSWTRIQNWSKL